MRTIMRAEVLGFKRFAGSLKDDRTGQSKSIDSGKLFVKVALNTQRNGADSFAAGFCTEELGMPNGEFCKVLEVDGRVQRGESVMVELELERVTNGKESRDMVVAAFVMDSKPKAKAA